MCVGSYGPETVLRTTGYTVLCPSSHASALGENPCKWFTFILYPQCLADKYLTAYVYTALAMGQALFSALFTY